MPSFTFNHTLRCFLEARASLRLQSFGPTPTGLWAQGAAEGDAERRDKPREIWCPGDVVIQGETEMFVGPRKRHFEAASVWTRSQQLEELSQILRVTVSRSKEKASSCSRPVTFLY